MSTSDKDSTLSVIMEEEEGFDVVTGDVVGGLVVSTGATVGELVLSGKGARVGGGLDGDSVGEFVGEFVGESVASVSVGFSVGCSVTGGSEGESVVLVGLNDGDDVPTGDGAGPLPWHSEVVQLPKMAKPTVKESLL